MKSITTRAMPLLASATLLTLLGVGMAGAATVSATANVKAPTICSISVTGGPVTYPNVTIGSGLSYESPNYLNITNTGNVNASVYISGSDWFVNGTTDLGASSIGWTNYREVYVSSLVEGGTDTTLSATPTQLFSSFPKVLKPNQMVGIGFALYLPSGVPVGTYSQNMSITASC